MTIIFKNILDSSGRPSSMRRNRTSNAETMNSTTLADFQKVRFNPPYSEVDISELAENMPERHLVWHRNP